MCSGDNRRLHWHLSMDESADPAWLTTFVVSHVPERIGRRTRSLNILTRSPHAPSLLGFALALAVFLGSLFRQAH